MATPEQVFQGTVKIGLPILDGAGFRIIKHSITAAPDGSEEDTGVDLPIKGVVMGVYVDVLTAEATGGTKTLDVGLLAGESGGDTNGLLAAVDVSTTGVKQGKATRTVGSNEVFFASTTLGALLAEFTAGSDVATDEGTNYERPHVMNGTARSLVVDAGSNDWVEFRGDIYVIVMDLD